MSPETFMSVLRLMDDELFGEYHSAIVEEYKRRNPEKGFDPGHWSSQVLSNYQQNLFEHTLAKHQHRELAHQQRLEMERAEMERVMENHLRANPPTLKICGI